MVEKRRQFIINFVYFGIIALLSIFALKFALGYLAPFIFGFLIAFTLKPIVTRLVNLFGDRKGDRKSVSILVILVFYTAIGFLLTWLLFRGIHWVGVLSESIPEMYATSIHPMVLSFLSWFEGLIGDLDPVISEQLLPMVDSAIDSISKFLPGFVTSIAGKLTSLLTSVPSMLISFLIAIISSFFFTTDYRNIVKGIMNFLPDTQRNLLLDVKEGIVTVLGQYLRAYGILMSLTFLELSVAFLILGVGNPIGFAFLIAVMDILPVLGTGTVMIPWAIIEITVGNQQLGISLAIVYVIITVIRNILEPKVVGKQIGLHPLLTLVCIYVGLKLFGFIGLLALPISATLIKSLYEDGKLTFMFSEEHQVKEKL